jgi:hypothetical protein
METLLNGVIYFGPLAFLLGLLVAVACMDLMLSRSSKSQVLRVAIVSAGDGLGGFIVGTMLGIAFFCSAASAGNLCGLGGVFGVGPLAAGLCMGVYPLLKLYARRDPS